MGRLLVAVAIVAATLVVARPADAAGTTFTGKFAYVTTATEVDAASDGVPTAVACPTGFSAVAAGGSLTGAPSAGARLAQFKYDFGVGGWFVGARNDTPVAQRQTVVEICLKTPASAPGVGVTTANGAGSYHEFFASCPPSNTLIGGGGGIDPPYALNFLFSNAPRGLTAQQWRMAGYATTMGDWSSTSVCETDGVLPAVQRVRKQVVLAPGQTRSVSVRCPSAMHVSSGGWDAQASVNVSFSRPIDGPDADRAPDDGWRITAYDGDSSANDSVVLSANAICVR